MHNIFLLTIYFLLAKVFSSLVLLPVSPLVVLESITFGLYYGFILSFVGNMFGAIFPFLLSRYFLKNFVQDEVYFKYPKMHQVERRLFRNPFLTVLILRLLPVFPFSAVSYFLGVTKINFKNFFWGTFLGMIPLTFIFSYFGVSIQNFSIIKILICVSIIVVFFVIFDLWKLKKENK